MIEQTLILFVIGMSLMTVCFLALMYAIEETNDANNSNNKRNKRIYKENEGAEKDLWVKNIIA